MDGDFDEDIAAIRSIKAVPTILDIVCRTTGMRFAAVARVTEKRWIACSVRDDIAFGLVPGGELKIETTICHEIRGNGKAVVIDHVAEDVTYANHHTPAMYGLQSYISIPIRLSDGAFFGTLCAVDPAPHKLNTPETIEMFEMFAEIIGSQLSTIDQIKSTEAHLDNELKTSALREQFIAVLGHDLRNPLMAIDAGAKLLLKTPLNEKAETLIKVINSSVARMSGLISDVTDFARSRLGGGLALERTTEPCEPILRQVVAELQLSSPARIIETDIALTEPVNCDRRRVAQLFSNLLGNAIAYGAYGKSIRTGAHTIDGWFELYVANDGAAIPAKVMENIFEPFSRGAHGHSLQGLGLGLYISHEIAEAHGGTLRVLSTPEETRFTFRMSLEHRTFE